MAPTAILSAALIGFMPSIATMTVGIVDKFAFDLDPTGRNRQTAWMIEKSQVAYREKGIAVNIAVWNMHLGEDHRFREVLESGLVPMGRGGGFRIVVFTGSGWIENHGHGGFDNWRCVGNLTKNGNRIEFRPV